MNEPDTNPPTQNPEGAGTAPFDQTNIVADVRPDTPIEADETRPATGPGPIGGEATVAASSWGGASDEEMEDLRRAERDETKPA